MTELRVLQEVRLQRADRAARERKARRRKRAAGATAVLSLSLVALLAVMAATPYDPSPPAASVSAPRAAPLPSHAPGVPAGYGTTPNAHPISVKLKLPLRSGLLFDVRSGRVLWQRDPTQVLPIASLTKMMTALVVDTHAQANARVMITKQAVHFTGSGVGLLPLGKRVRALALLYGLLLPSGNDAAIALAQHVAGNQGRFVGMMNAEARALDLRCTHYTTVSGVIDQGNHSCAVDLAVIAHTLLSHPLLRKIVATSSVVLPFPIKGGKLYLYNNNPLYQQRFLGTDGIKTGYTTKAGLCIVATVRRGRAWLGVVLLHSGNWAVQAETLLDAGFAAAPG